MGRGAQTEVRNQRSDVSENPVRSQSSGGKAHPGFPAFQLPSGPALITTKPATVGKFFLAVTGCMCEPRGGLLRFDSACFHFFADFEMAALHGQVGFVIQLLIPLTE